MLQLIVDLQRDIYLAFAERIRIFAETGDCAQLAVFLPLGIVFGAVHALTPGHSKIVLATYLAGPCSCRMTEPVRWSCSRFTPPSPNGSSEERRVGKDAVISFRSRGSSRPLKKTD